MNEQEVRTLLTDLAETPAPPSRVVVPTAARRYPRPRPWLAAAAAVLVVALAAGTYLVTGGSRETAAPGPAAHAPQRFDPLIQYASFGWLPEEHRMNSQATSVSGSRFAMQVAAYDPAANPLDARLTSEVNVLIYAAGVQPGSEEPLAVWGPSNSPDVPTAPVSDAPPVNGIPALWVTVPGDPETLILKWRYAQDAWAEVVVSRLSGDLHESAHRVASELRIGQERLRFPFHLTGLEPGLRPVSSTIQEGGQAAPWRVDLDFATADDDVSLRFSASPMGRPYEPDTTVDGHEARREMTTGPQYGDSLFVYDVSGLETGIVVQGTTAADLARVGPDGALGVFRTVTVHPDRSEWTDRPLR